MSGIKELLDLIGVDTVPQAINAVARLQTENGLYGTLERAAEAISMNATGLLEDTINNSDYVVSDFDLAELTQALDALVALETAEKSSAMGALLRLKASLEAAIAQFDAKRWEAAEFAYRLKWLRKTAAEADAWIEDLRMWEEVGS